LERRGSNKGELVGGHAVALIGANLTDKEVCILDPWYPRPKNGAGAAPGSWRQHMSVADFNGIFKWDEPWVTGISLMYKKQPSATAAIKHINEHRDLMWW